MRRPSYAESFGCLPFVDTFSKSYYVLRGSVIAYQVGAATSWLLLYSHGKLTVYIHEFAFGRHNSIAGGTASMTMVAHPQPGRWRHIAPSCDVGRGQAGPVES